MNITTMVWMLCIALVFGNFVCVVCEAQSWPEGVSSPELLPGCEKLLRARPALFEGGGAVVE